jgi:hypothetical protein
MFDTISNFENAVARRGLYRVWIRAHEGENAALISVWIDPAMKAFDPSAEEQACGLEAVPDLPPGNAPWFVEPHSKSAALLGHAAR